MMRVVIAKEYNRVLAKPVYNCPTCFEQKERAKPYAASTIARSSEPSQSVANSRQKGTS